MPDYLVSYAYQGPHIELGFGSIVISGAEPLHAGNLLERTDFIREDPEVATFIVLSISPLADEPKPLRKIPESPFWAVKLKGSAALPNGMSDMAGKTVINCRVVPEGSMYAGDFRTEDGDSIFLREEVAEATRMDKALFSVQGKNPMMRDFPLIFGAHYDPCTEFFVGKHANTIQKISAEAADYTLANGEPMA